jgi:hypothetical protein
MVQVTRHLLSLYADCWQRAFSSYLPMSEKVFDPAWEVLAECGACDGMYSHEYYRVRQEWIEANCPPSVVAFIRAAANRPPMQRGG